MLISGVMRNFCLDHPQRKLGKEKKEQKRKRILHGSSFFLKNKKLSTTNFLKGNYRLIRCHFFLL